MHFTGKVALAVAAGAMAGVFAAFAVLHFDTLPGAIKNGPWRTGLDFGNRDAGLAARAAVALHGLFALNRKETLYFTATTDSDGSPLNGACAYRIYGRDPDARWWSITAYGADDYLIANPDNRYSISRSTLVRKPDGAFEAEISPKPGDLNWIAVVPGPFSLTLRLYNPSEDVAADPARAHLPQIHRWACT